jgi:hypothetical protein
MMKPEQIIKEHMARIGKAGGKKGGKSTSKKKRDAARKSLAQARKLRWNSSRNSKA